MVRCLLLFVVLFVVGSCLLLVVFSWLFVVRCLLVGCLLFGVRCLLCVVHCCWLFIVVVGSWCLLHMCVVVLCWLLSVGRR